MDAGHARATTSRRRRATTARHGLPRAQHQRLSAAAGPLYLGYIDGGMFVIDITDKANPKPLSHWTNSPPYHGFTHTALPLFDRDLLVVTDESTENNAEDWPKLVWILDARDETNPVPIATCPLPPVDAFANRGGRFGAHNIHENVPCRPPGTPTRS